jgi:hypothetical protein
MCKRSAEMLVVDDLPFSHVEDLGFSRLMAECSPQYRLKTRKFYTSIVCNDIYDSVSTKILALVKDLKKDGNKISFTTDACRDTTAGVSLLSLTAHAINDSYEKVNLVLSAQLLNERHTGEYLS